MTELPFEETLILAIEGDAKRFCLGKNSKNKTKRDIKEIEKIVCLEETLIGFKQYIVKFDIGFPTKVFFKPRRI